MHILLIGCGPHAKAKYIPFIEGQVKLNKISGYSILELNSWKDKELFAAKEIQPQEIYYLEDKREQGLWFDDEGARTLIDEIKTKHKNLKIIISTEPKTHYGYIKLSIQNQIDCLIDKPITLPLIHEPTFAVDTEKIRTEYDELCQLALKYKGSYSVMTPRRYHEIYHHKVSDSVAKTMLKYQVPITSLNISHQAGVWNLTSEFASREDHPYKYGYGMLMHSGYHYVDMLSRLLCLNKAIFPSKKLSLEINSYAAYPTDNIRFPNHLLGENVEAESSEANFRSFNGFGETDITANFALRCQDTDRVITLGNLSLWQTSPSLRNWVELPDVYNKNGRYSLEKIDLNQSFLFSISTNILKAPISRVNSNFGHKFTETSEVITRSNSNLIEKSDFYNKEEFCSQPGEVTLLEKARKDLLQAWFNGEESKSHILTHKETINLTYALLNSLKKDKTKVVIDF